MALDFVGYSFLPPSFFAFVLNQGDHSCFTDRIASRVVYPPSAELAAMISASCASVPFSSNDIGEQISWLSFFFSLPFLYKNAEFNVLHRSFEGAQVQALANTAHKSSPVQQDWRHQG